jgi:hypothetical protein
MDPGIGGEVEKLPQQPLQTSFAAEQRNEGLMSIATKATPQAGREDHEGSGHPLTQSSATLHIHTISHRGSPIWTTTNKPALNLYSRKEIYSQMATETNE